MKNNHLDLRVPIHITDIQFSSTDSKSPSRVVTISKFRHFRLYDITRDGRRPLVSVEVGEYPLRCLQIVNNGR